MLSAIAAGAVLVSGAAYAQTSGYKAEAKLLNAATAPREETISGAAWRCDGDACVGAAAHKGNVDGVVRECKKVVAVIGPVASYRTQGRQLDDGQLRACNKDAVQLQTARN
jgi:hypothetical protein